jgi:hypothetical protein
MPLASFHISTKIAEETQPAPNTSPQHAFDFISQQNAERNALGFLHRFDKMLKELPLASYTS